jgi:hypothetical protein
MPSVSSHPAPGFWAFMSPTYYPDDGDLEHQDNLVRGRDQPEDGRTPVSFSAGRWVTAFSWKGLQLDKTIDRIGMGSYQWTLLSLCGFGDFLPLQVLVLAQFLRRLDGRQCLTVIFNGSY